MTDAEARRLVARAMQSYESALNDVLAVLRARYPSDARDTDAWSIAGQVYAGHRGIRTLRIRVERETEGPDV